MISGSTYLVHFPDCTETVHTIVLGAVVPGHRAEPGTEVLPGWIVTRLELNPRRVGGRPVTFDVWVTPRLESVTLNCSTSELEASRNESPGEGDQTAAVPIRV